MKTSIAIMTGILLMGVITPLASADKVPDWIKDSADGGQKILFQMKSSFQGFSI